MVLYDAGGIAVRADLKRILPLDFQQVGQRLKLFAHVVIGHGWHDGILPRQGAAHNVRSTQDHLVPTQHFKYRQRRLPALVVFGINPLKSFARQLKLIIQRAMVLLHHDIVGQKQIADVSK